MDTIATEFLKSTASGTLLGLLVGILMLAWLRFVDRWLVDGIDTAAADEWWQPYSDQFARQNESIAPQHPIHGGRSLTAEPPVAPLRSTPTDSPQWDSLRRDAVRRAALNGLDRISLRWREDARRDSLNLWSRFDPASRPRRHPGEIELGN